MLKPHFLKKLIGPLEIEEQRSDLIKTLLRGSFDIIGLLGHDAKV